MSVTPLKHDDSKDNGLRKNTQAKVKLGCTHPVQSSLTTSLPVVFRALSSYFTCRKKSRDFRGRVISQSLK
jgi:hypothetical protein